MGCRRKKESRPEAKGFGLSNGEKLLFVDLEKAMTAARLARESWGVLGYDAHRTSKWSIALQPDRGVWTSRERCGLEIQLWYQQCTEELQIWN